MNFTSADAATLAEIMRWRRDVRHFRSDPLPAGVLDRLCAAMDAAPSVGNARPWRVIRVLDARLRAAVRDDFARCNAAALAGYAGTQADAYARLKLAGLEAAPEHLAVFTATDPAEGHGLGRQTFPETLRQSTAMAVFALWLAARAENVGLGMVSILEPRHMEQLFFPDTGLPSQPWEFAAYLCLGYPADDDDTPLLHRVGWQRNQPTTWETR
ncbi:MAG: 5,6-dimethylbenzimidazole synthase [Hyphomicrobium sp.]